MRVGVYLAGLVVPGMALHTGQLAMGLGTALACLAVLAAVDAAAAFAQHWHSVDQELANNRFERGPDHG